MRKLVLAVLLATAWIVGASVDPAAATNYVVSGTVVKPDGTPKANTRVTVTLVFLTSPPNTDWFTFSTYSTSNGTFTLSHVENTALVEKLIVQAHLGFPTTIPVPDPTDGIFNVGEIISGNCRTNCPLPEDGSGNP